MKSSRVIAAGALLLFLLSPLAGAKEAPDKMLGSLPLMIGTFIAERPNVYADPRLGASIGYNDATGIAITLYVYDEGLGDIEDGCASKLMSNVKERSLADIMASWSNVRLTYDGTKSLSLPDGKKRDVIFVQVSFESAEPGDESGRILSSDLYLLGAKGYICKFRITRPVSIPEEKKTEIDQVVAELIGKLAA